MIKVLLLNFFGKKIKPFPVRICYSLLPPHPPSAYQGSYVTISSGGWQALERLHKTPPGDNTVLGKYCGMGRQTAL